MFNELRWEYLLSVAWSGDRTSATAPRNFGPWKCPLAACIGTGVLGSAELC